MPEGNGAARPPGGRVAAAHSQPRRQWLSGLGTRLIVAQLFVAAIMIAVAFIGYSQMANAELRLLRVYNHRVLPLRSLWQVADEFAIDFVDAVHKVSDGSLAPSAGARVLTRVRDDATSRWRNAEQLMTTPAERALLHGMGPLLRVAQQSLGEALDLMLSSDVVALRQWRAGQLYARIDPLTARLSGSITSNLHAAHQELVVLMHGLSRSAMQGALALSVAGLFSVTIGVFVASRFVVSLRQIDAATRAAASGDLNVRVGLSGHDELASMAGSIDNMIGAIQQSQTRLAEQAAALARSEAATRAASAAKSAFLSNVSHELRTPLNVVLGYAQVLLRDEQTRPEHTRGLSRILDAGNHLLTLIDDLLGMTRLEANQLELNALAFSPLGLLDDVVRMLKVRAEAKGLALTALPTEPMPVAVAADRRRLLQVLLNLAGNAIKFTPRGSVSITMAWSQQRLAFEIIDTGPGISAEEQASLFSTFTQGTLGRQSGEGTGLGLYLSQSLVRLMGGEIRVKSALGRGCCFSFSVRAPEAQGSLHATAQQPQRRRAPALRLAPMLVVDDRERNREVLRALLESAGFTVQEANEGQAALDWLAKHRASLVWLDLRMPGLDGFETLKALRAREAAEGGARTPVVAITASVVDIDAARAEALDFDALVIKPFVADAVLDTIERLLRLKLVVDPVRPQPGSTVSTGGVDQLSACERAQLLQLLRLGDIREACAWLERVGPAGAGLRSEIEAFRTDAIMTQLQQSHEAQ
jgi:signal transduction histidine kinase/FixJ family two-component response regulator